MVLALTLAAGRTNLCWAAPMGTAFTYQGRLTDANNPADGLYDLRFRLYDSPAAGAQKGNTIDIGELDVVDGYLTIELNFGGEVFDGNARWLEIGVRPGQLKDPNQYTALGPRQQVNPTPYALYAKTAGQDGGWIISGNNMYTMVAGNVGIGTANPQKLLHIANRNGGYDGLGISLDPHGGGFTGGTIWEIDNDGGVFKISEHHTCGPGTERMVIAAVGNCTGSPYAGRVGIGTDSPLWKLDVHGAIRAQDQLLASNDNGSISLTPLRAYAEINAQRSSPGGQPANIALAPNGGNVGIGTTTPSAPLDVRRLNAGSNQVAALFSNPSDNPSAGVSIDLSVGAGLATEWRFRGTSSALYIENAAAAPPAVTIMGNGNIGVGTTTPGTYKLAVNGSAAKPGGGSWSTFSDVRLKQIDDTYDRGLEEILQLNPVRYRYKEANELGLPADKKYVGVVSQEVQNVIPEAVEEDAKGHLMVNNEPVIWAMVNAIKQLKTENETLQRRIEALERQLNRQRSLSTTDSVRPDLR